MTDSGSLFAGKKAPLPSSTPTSWASNPSAMRDRERRSKSNADRPAKAAASSMSRFPQPDFTGHSAQHDGMVMALSVPVPRGLRGQAIPVASVQKSLRGEGLMERPVLDRVVARACSLDYSGTPSPSQFSIFPSLPDEHFLTVEIGRAHV